MEIRYSVIIPTYNRAEQLLLTLVSLETQTYPKQQFEVIVVDDGSTDDTRTMVEGFSASYPLVYLATEERRGRAAARNVGLQHATGKYIIFCDCDFVVLPEFIRIIDNYHRKYQRAVLSAIPNSWRSVYTHYHPDFSPEEKEQFRQVLTKANLWKEEYEQADQIIPVITPRDLMERTDQLSKVIIPWNIDSATRREFAKTDVAPWIMLITRCVSMKRRYLTRIGGFNERFVKYGMEDWDLGYRLHRLMIPFYSIRTVVGYHQEHPAYIRGSDPVADNLRIMYEEHGLGDPELNLIPLLHPSEKAEEYKNTLRMLRLGMKSKAARPTARLLNKTLRTAAMQFVRGRKIKVYQNDLQDILKKMKSKASIKIEKNKIRIIH